MGVLIYIWKIEEVPIEVKEWMMEMKNAVDEEDGEEKKRDVKDDQPITFYKGKPYSSYCIRRIIKNASIGVLKIKLTGSEEFHREVFNLIKEFKAKSLDLGIHKRVGNELLKEMMVDSYFHDLTKACEALRVNVQDNRITPEALQQMYKNMVEGCVKLRYVCIESNMEQVISFLNLIGFIFRNDEFSSYKDIKVYGWKENNKFGVKYSILDGCFEIMIDRSVFEYDYGGLIIKRRKTQDSLEHFVPPTEAGNEIDKEHGDYFNILGLISHVFSFLSMEDRLRVRVNKRLDAIELSSTY